ncbi:MAG: hypothetical protein Q611_LSC00087G0003, partial [Leuconostoc sp. DORA_2]
MNKKLESVLSKEPRRGLQYAVTIIIL